MYEHIWNINSQELVISSMKPAANGPITAAIMPRLPEIPTNVPVYLGPKSAWLTPKPPAAIPVQIFVAHKREIIKRCESWNGI